MAYNFPPDVNQRVSSLLGTGYQNVDELLRAALSALEREQQEIAAIQEGVEQIDSGSYRSLEEVDAEIRKKHGFPSSR